MIIVCPQCTTKFNVSSDRLPGPTTKVRCARCRHVFVVEITDSAHTEGPATQLHDSASRIEESATAVSMETPVRESDETDFSYDRFQELDSTEESVEQKEIGAQETEPDHTEEDFSLTTSAETPPEAAGTTELPPPGREPAPAADQQPAEPEFPQTAEQEKKSGAFSSLIRILLLVILGILIILGILVYTNGPDQLNQVIQQLLGQQTGQSLQPTGQISLGKLEGRFIQNEQAGELFLIRGEAINNYPAPRAGIQVKGVIYDPNGNPLLQKTVFCGNPIKDENLQSLSFQELEKIMANQFGAGLKNMKLDPGQIIAFDIVFKDLPQNLAEFSVTVTNSKPATK